MAQTVDEYLSEKYNETGTAGAFYGIEKFYRAVKKDGKYKVSRKQIKNFLLANQPYTLHRGVKRKFSTRKVIAPFAGYQVDLDCAYMTEYTEDNEGFGYFLAGIDCFSKLAYTVPLKSLKGSEVSKAVEILLNKFPYKFLKARSDIGSEFKSKLTQNVFKKLGIEHFYSYNTSTKASLVERLIKSLKSLLYRYMSTANTHKWVDQIENITNTYNNSYHSTIKRSPASVTKADEHTLWKRIYDAPIKSTKVRQKLLPAKHLLKLNDTVRLSSVKGKFDRDFHQHWSREHFLVSELLFKQGIPVYKIKDLKNEPIIGTFYHDELQRIIVDDEKDTYIIEKIEKRRGAKSYVKWLGWDRRFNTWLDNSTIKNYQTRK